MKRKIIFSIFKVFFLALVFICFASVKNAYAGFPCTVSPTTVDPNGSITIDGNGNYGITDKFYISIDGGKIGSSSLRPIKTGSLFSPSAGKLTLFLGGNYRAGTHSIGVYSQHDENTNLCSNNPSVTVNSTAASGGDSCAIVPSQPIPFNPKPSDYVSFKITGSQATIGSADDQLRTLIKINDSNGPVVWSGCIRRGDLANSFGFGYFTSSSYYLEVRDKCNTSDLFFWNNGSIACYANFSVDANGGAFGGSGTPDNPITLTPCGVNGSSGTCAQVNTGLGPISTSPQGLIQSIFGIILSISGGIAVLMIIISGYRVLSSQGNPEALKGAREQLIAAIVGLLFIIFSLAILQIVGVNILHIPRFK